MDLHKQIQNLVDHSVWGVVLRSGIEYKDWTASCRIPTSQPVSIRVKWDITRFVNIFHMILLEINPEHVA